MKIIDSGDYRDSPKTDVLIGREIVAIGFNDNGEVAIKLNNGMIVMINGQGHETNCVDIVIDDSGCKF